MVEKDHMFNALQSHFKQEVGKETDKIKARMSMHMIRLEDGSVGYKAMKANTPRKGRAQMYDRARSQDSYRVNLGTPGGSVEYRPAPETADGVHNSKGVSKGWLHADGATYTRGGPGINVEKVDHLNKTAES